MNKQQAHDRAMELNAILKHTKYHAEPKKEHDGTYSVIVQDTHLLAEQFAKKNKLRPLLQDEQDGD